MRQAKAFCAFAVCALIGGCSTPERPFPSLAIRDAERVMGELAAAEPGTYVPAPLPMATANRVDSLEQQARAAHARFLDDVAAARSNSNAARGNARGEAWAKAQIAIADLEGHRAELMITLADLDAAYVETSNAGEAIAEIAAARNAVGALLEAENAIIAEMLALVGQ